MLLFNCTALSQSESSNFFIYIIKNKNRVGFKTLHSGECCPYMAQNMGNFPKPSLSSDIDTKFKCF